MPNAEDGKTMRGQSSFLMPVFDARGWRCSLALFALFICGLALSPRAIARNPVSTPAQISGLAMAPRVTARKSSARALVTPAGLSGRAKSAGTKTHNAIVAAAGTNSLLVQAQDPGFIPATAAFDNSPVCSASDLQDNHDLARLNPEWKAVLGLNIDPANPVLNIQNDPPTILEGVVPSPSPTLGPNDQPTSEVSEEDIMWNHYSHDFTFKVVPDKPYQHLLSSWVRYQGTTFPIDLNNVQSVPDCVSKGGVPDFGKSVCVVPPETCDDGSTTDTCHHTDMEVEWENASLMDENGDFQRIGGAVPEFVWPGVGDRVWVSGRWIFDCGHPSVPKAAPTTDFVKFSTEIHPPRALATFRVNHPALDSFPTPRVSAPNFPGMQSYLPVTGVPVILGPDAPNSGPTPVAVTEADIYVTGNGGGANDLCMILATNDDNDCKFGHTTSVIPVNNTNYVFDVYPPGTDYTQTSPNGTFPVNPPVPDASLQWRTIDHFSELPAHTCGGPDNTSCVTVDPIFCLIDANTPPPTQAETGCPAVAAAHPTRLRVILPFAGSAANFFAQSVLLGWDDVPTPGIAPRVRNFNITLHAFTVKENGESFIHSGDWRVFVNVGGQYRYIDPFFDRNTDGSNKCNGDALTDNGDDDCFLYDQTPWFVSVQDGTPIHVAVGGWESDLVDGHFCKQFPPGGDCDPFGTGDLLALVTQNNDRIGPYEFDLLPQNNYQWVSTDGTPLTEFTTQETSDGENYKVEFRVDEIPAATPPASSPIQVGTPHFGNFVSSATPVVLSSASPDAEGFQYRSYLQGGPLPTFSSPQPFPVHWAHADLPTGSQSVPVFLSGADGPNVLQYSAESFANLLEPRHTATGLVLDGTPPVVSIVQPQATTFTHSAVLTLNYSANDGNGSGVASFAATMDGLTTLPGGVGLQNGQRIRLLRELALGPHTFTVSANDNVNNTGSSSVTFTIIVTRQSILDDVRQFFQDGSIRHEGLAEQLLHILDEAGEEQARDRCSHAARIYGEFIEEVQEHTNTVRDRDRGIDPAAAAIMIADAQYLIAHCP